MTLWSSQPEWVSYYSNGMFQIENKLKHEVYKNYYSLPAAAAVSGLFRELIITNPNPSLSLRWMVTSLGCRFWLATVSGGEEPVVDGAEFWKGAELLQNILELKSLLGELCWVDPGLRPFSGQGSPEDNRARMKINMVIYTWLIG